MTSKNMDIRVFSILVILCVGGQGVNLNEGGSINDLFVSNDDNDYESDQYSEVKKEVGVESNFAQELFKIVEKKLQIRLDELANHGNSIIPIVTMKAIEQNANRLPEDIIAKVKQHGVLVVRNTLPKEEIEELIEDLHQYLQTNGIDTETYNEVSTLPFIR